MDTTSSGICSQCGHENERRWILCDSCDARLPWAPPKKARLSASEMTDEQIRVFYSPTPKREPFFLLTMQGRPVIGAIVALLIIAWLWFT